MVFFLCTWNLRSNRKCMYKAGFNKNYIHENTIHIKHHRVLPPQTTVAR